MQQRSGGFWVSSNEDQQLCSVGAVGCNGVERSTLVVVPRRTPRRQADKLREPEAKAPNHQAILANSSLAFKLVASQKQPHPCEERRVPPDRFLLNVGQVPQQRCEADGLHSASNAVVEHGQHHEGFGSHVLHFFSVVARNQAHQRMDDVVPHHLPLGVVRGQQVEQQCSSPEVQLGLW